ncbi:uncharacterized protein LOC124185743 [Neodiprion fabricii]|uniref:uncharacterized protein LOC124185743 n=1 Tax=Neodiprion fabricii TaxID=2872261 RepID=UPI001ED8CC2A|nr:uncharacterized protein LOC124185743 [Neodiprion fabricii]
MTFQRCAFVVGILVCYSSSLIQADFPRLREGRQMNIGEICLQHPFHPQCRGIQSKRSSSPTNEVDYRTAHRLEDLFGMTDGSRKPSHSSRSGNSIDNNYDRSRLLTALLDRGLNPDVIYDWYMNQVQEKNDGNRGQLDEDNFPGSTVIGDDY